MLPIVYPKTFFLVKCCQKVFTKSRQLSFKIAFFQLGGAHPPQKPPCPLWNAALDVPPFVTYTIHIRPN